MPYERVVRSTTEQDGSIIFVLACGCLHDINVGQVFKCGDRIKVDNDYVLAILAEGAKKSKYHRYHAYHNCTRR